MKRCWHSWVQLMDERESPLRLAQVRIALGVVMIVDLFWVVRYGLVDVIWAPPEGGGLGLLASGESPPWAYAVGHQTVFWLAAVSSITFTLGLFTRFSTGVLLVSYAQLAAMTTVSDRGIDTMFRAVLLILLFSECGAAFSLDARRGKGKTEAPAWPRYLIVLQLVWTYFSAGVHKTQSAWWPAGDFAALSRVLQDPHFARFDMAPLLDAPGVGLLTQISTAATMLFELGAPLLLLALYYRRTADQPGRVRRFFNKLPVRQAWITLGVVFHLGLLFTLRLGVFPLGMLAFYPALIPPPAHAPKSP